MRYGVKEMRKVLTFEDNFAELMKENVVRFGNAKKKAQEFKKHMDEVGIETKLKSQFGRVFFVELV